MWFVFDPTEGGGACVKISLSRLTPRKRKLRKRKTNEGSQTDASQPRKKNLHPYNSLGKEKRRDKTEVEKIKLAFVRLCVGI